MPWTQVERLLHERMSIVCNLQNELRAHTQK